LNSVLIEARAASIIDRTNENRERERL